VIEFRGAEIEVAGGDITTLPSLADGTYESEELDDFLSHVPREAVVVDIGANIGIWSVLMSRAVGPGGTVLAFEPSPANAALLRANLDRNGCENVVVVEAAVRRTSGSGRLDTASPGATHKIANGAVEGYEPESIAGMTKTLDTRPVFLAEFSMPQSEQAGTNWSIALGQLGTTYHECRVYDGRAPTWVPSSDLLDLTSNRKLLDLLFGTRAATPRGR